jgi:hypothetical protein
MDLIQADVTDGNPLDNEYEIWQASYKGSNRVVWDPIAYWHEKRLVYPCLLQIALNFLTIQSMPAECKRLFLAAGQMVVPQWSNLLVRTVGMCQVLRLWFQAGIIDKLSPLFLSITEEKRELESIHLNDDEFERRELSWLVGNAQQLADEEST